MKKANLKGYTLYDSNQMTSWKRQQNYGDNKKYQELEVRREEQEEHRDFLGQWILYVAL